ncbi:MAG TPA: phospholipase D-like domain-containing protein [Planctomycetota bacterium]
MPFDIEFDVVYWIAKVLVSAISAGHALLYKRDSRSALGWIIVCVAFPGWGALFYWVFGINYIQTRGKRLQRIWPLPPLPGYERAEEEVEEQEPAKPAPRLPAELQDLCKTAEAVTGRELVSGNAVRPLFNGDQAYPEMLAAIAAAERSVCLLTYIFETNATGRRFVDALYEAHARGVEVKVLVDGVGERYSWPRISKLLRARGIRVERFNPNTLLKPNLHFNLRNHRKILTVDAGLGFTGGMNLGGRHMVGAPECKRPVQDLHFRVEGPVVAHMEHAFLQDWCFASGDPEPELALRPASACGPALCRGISDGPNEDMDKLRWILLGALGAARRRVRIMTPYFVPDRELIAAMSAAALRGIAVELMLPEKSNLPFVDWATRAMLWEILQHGVEVLLQPGPFAHSKLFLVDKIYAQVGSANLDPRSLRLNFEYNLEVYDVEFAAAMNAHFDAMRAKSRPLLLKDVDARSFPVRFRDSLARLASPYL